MGGARLGDAAPGMAAVTSVMRAQQILQARVDDVLRPFGLTFARYEVLMLLHFTSRGSLPIKMGERLQVHPTSITNAVDRLERPGWSRRPHPTDGRATLVEISGAGRHGAGGHREAQRECLRRARSAAAPGPEPQLGDQGAAPHHRGRLRTDPAVRPVGAAQPCTAASTTTTMNGARNSTATAATARAPLRASKTSERPAVHVWRAMSAARSATGSAAAICCTRAEASSRGGTETPASFSR